MTVTQLEYFLLVGEKLNFTKAAEELFVSQSVLSRQISALEQELGVELFVRERRGLSFTPTGQVFFTALKPQVREFKTLLRRISSQGKAKEINVSFGLANLGIIQPKQKQLIDMLRGQECGGTVSLVSKGLDELFAMLMGGELDLMCLPRAMAEEHREQLAFFPFIKNRMYLIYSPAASGIKPEPDSLRDFADVPVISFFPHHRKHLTELCQPYGFVPKFAHTRDVDIIPAISVQGYIFLSPEWSILGRGKVFNNYCLDDFPLDIDVLAWRKDNLNPAISLIEAKKPLLCLPE